MSSLGAIMQSSIPQGVLQSEPSVYQALMDAARQAFLETTTTGVDASRVRAVSQQSLVLDPPAQLEPLRNTQHRSRDERDGQNSSNSHTPSTSLGGYVADAQIQEQEAQDSNLPLLTANFLRPEDQTRNEDLGPELSAPLIPVGPYSTVRSPIPVNPELPSLDENPEDWFGSDSLMDIETNYSFENGLLPQDFSISDETMQFSALDFGDYGQAIDADNSLSSLLERTLTPKIAEEMKDAKKNAGKNRACAFRDLDD